MGAGDRRVWINFIDTLQRDIRTPDEAGWNELIWAVSSSVIAWLTSVLLQYFGPKIRDYFNEFLDRVRGQGGNRGGNHDESFYSANG